MIAHDDKSDIPYLNKWINENNNDGSYFTLKKNWDQS